MVTQVKPPEQKKTPRSRPKKRMSQDEFFVQTEGMFAEWVDGEVIYLSVTDLH